MEKMETTIPGDIVKEIVHFGDQLTRFNNKAMPEEKFKRFRLQHGIYGQRQKGVQMVRVKIPAGLLNAEKLRCLADVCEKYTKGIGHVTTRQDIQFHYVDLNNVPTIMTRLAEVGLTTREACGNTVRNVTSCHRAGLCPTELFDINPISETVAYHLLRHPINQDLPRKFKISFSGCNTECGLAAIHDIGFIAASREVGGERECGFKVYVGGGLGSHPKLAQLYAEFLPLDKVLPLCEALLKIFDVHGNRKNKSKARMKFILEKWGLSTFKEKVAEELKEIQKSGMTFPKLPQPMLKVKHPSSPSLNGFGTGGSGTNYEAWAKTNLLPQPDGSSCAVQIKLRLGDLTASQLGSMADIVDQFSPSGIRTTHQQNLILHGVTREQLPALYETLIKIGLADSGVERIADVIACPGADTCQLALTGSMGMGGALVDTLARELETDKDLDGLRIRISGCPNSCGHHHIAGIGLHGVAKKIHGKLVPHYQFHFGGEVNAEQSVLGRSKLKLPAKNVPAAVMETLSIFRENREKEENFNHFVERFSREKISAKLEKFTTLPPPEEDPEAYLDWNADKAFSLDDLGPGECSGTVIDMIEYNMRMAGETIKKAVQASDETEAISLLKKAILFDCRGLLYTYGIDSKHDDQILKEFQHKLVEQGILTERFERFTKDLGTWADFEERTVPTASILEDAADFVTECQAAYDRMDASMKLRKKEPSESQEEEKTMEENKKADIFLDLSGVECPMNFVKTKLQLEDMEEGQTLEVIIDDGEPVRNVPRSVKAEGHNVMALDEIPDGHYSLVIEKVGS